MTASHGGEWLIYVFISLSLSPSLNNYSPSHFSHSLIKHIYLLDLYIRNSVSFLVSLVLVTFLTSLSLIRHFYQ